MNPPTLIEKLQQHVKCMPHHDAIIFLEDGENKTGHLTYALLLEKIQRVALGLQKQGLAQKRILLMREASLEFVIDFLACLYIGAIPVPVAAPSQYTLPKLLPHINAVITNADLEYALGPSNLIGFCKIHLIDTASYLQETTKITLAPFPVTPKHIAYLQYTSGSTSSPKGAVVTYENLMHSIIKTIKHWSYSASSVTLTWSPPAHVYGLVCGLLIPLYNGTPTIVMPPSACILQPIRWLKAISHYHVTHSGSSNFGYDLCVNHIADDELNHLDLRHWQVAVNGGEFVLLDTLLKFSEKMQPYGFSFESFYPVYGMSETAGLIASKCGRQSAKFISFDQEASQKKQILPAKDNKPVKTVVSCGTPIEGMEMIIVDPDTAQQSGENTIGEIWLSGKSCTSPYWHKLRYQHEIPYIKTGDLGFIRNGELYLTGRLKELIIIHGKNYYPSDIENTIAYAHPLVKGMRRVAFSIQNNEEQLIIIQEIGLAVLASQLKEVEHAIHKAIFYQHGIKAHEIVLTHLDTIPMTHSGKIMRGLSRDYYLTTRFENRLLANTQKESKI
jgi:acyl-CoA synthetase (AMP-forming)/AMP-acid ligase II